MVESLCLTQNFINGGAGDTELPGYYRCPRALTVKRQHAVSVNGAPAAKPDAF